jgi:hypothetical protein
MALPNRSSARERPRFIPPLLERRHVFAVPQLALAAAILMTERVPHRGVIAGVLVADAAVHLPRWPVPRRPWSGRAYWGEAMLYLAPTVAGTAFGVAAGDRWATAMPNAWWFAAALPTAAALLALSRVDILAMVSGVLAVLLEPDRRSHALARATSILVAPVGEEGVFRGAGIGLPAPHPVLVPLSTAAFVARHHLVRGVPRSSRETALLAVAAVAFTALAVASGSIYPSMLAHTLHNAPRVALEAHVARVGT